MNYTAVIKSILPTGLWPMIRKYIIVKKHRKVSETLSYLVDDCATGRLEVPNFTKKADLPDNGKIIWQYWAQGYGSEDLPELVRICLDSVEKYAGDYKLIRLTDENLAEYIDLPQHIFTKRELIPLGHFSDLLRLILLTTYGGGWLDACILLTGNLPDTLFNVKGGKFFMYQRDINELHKKYWENSFAYYFGWYKGFRVNVLNGIMCAKAGNEVIKDLCTMLSAFWKTHKSVPDYFFFQILFDIYKQISG